MRTGCSGNCPPNRLISSEVLLPLLRSNYGAHLDSLTTKRRELARLDLWQVVIRWRLFFPRGTSIFATSEFPSSGARNLNRARAGVLQYYYDDDDIKNDSDWICFTLCTNSYLGVPRGSSTATFLTGFKSTFFGVGINSI